MEAVAAASLLERENSTLRSELATSLRGENSTLRLRMRGEYSSTRPNISESHSEVSTRVPFCIARAQVLEYPPEH